MAPPKKYTGEKLLIMVETSPSVFAHDCLINTERGVEYKTQSNELYEPDCDDLNKIPARSMDITGTAVTISGSGTMHSPSWDFWFEWWQSGESKNVKVKENILAADGGGTETGAYKLTSMTRTGTHKETVTVSLTLESDGAIVRAANAA